jgi:hypothetical protein
VAGKRKSLVIFQEILLTEIEESDGLIYDKIVISEITPVKTEITQVNTEITLVNSDFSTQRKGKERKGKETKFKSDDLNSSVALDSDKIFSEWNSFADKNGLAKIQILTGGRKQKIKARLNNSLFNFSEILNKIENSDFLLGKIGNWKVNFDFVIQNDINYIKIIEGKYDNNDHDTGTSPEQRSIDAHNKRILEKLKGSENGTVCN